MGEFIDDARNRGVLDDERWDRYLRQGIRPRLTVRSEVAQGDEFGWGIETEVRMGLQPVVVLFRAVLKSIDGQNVVPTTTKSTAPVRVADQQLEVNGGLANMMPAVGMVVPGSTHLPWSKLTRNGDIPLGPGQHTIEVDCKIEYSYPMHMAPQDDGGVVRLYRTITVHPPGSIQIRPITDPSLLAAIKASLGDVNRWRPAIRRSNFLQQTLKALGWDDNRDSLSFHIMVTDPPVGIAFDVFVRDNADGIELAVNRNIACEPGARRSFSLGTGELPECFAEDGQINIILRSSAEAALTNHMMDSFWSGEIVYEDVAIESPDR